MAGQPLFDESQLRELLEVLGPPAHLEVLAERQELLRFGASRVTYQHSEERMLVRAKLIRDGRLAWGTLGTLERSALQALRERLEGLMPSLPAGPEEVLLGPAAPRRPARTCFRSTADATAQERMELLRRAAAAFPREASLGGSIVHSVVHHSVGNSAGLFQAESRTRAAMQLVSTLDGRSSYGRVIHRDADVVADSDLPEVVRNGLVALPARSLEPGRYRAVLAPQAVITLLATFGYAALGARAYAAGDSPLSGRMGERVASPLVHLSDDGCDEAGLPTTFDCEGAPKLPVALIEGGLLRGVVHDAETARQAGVASTGHRMPPAWRFGAGPSPTHLLLAPGGLSQEGLVAECGTGLLIQRVDYVRVVQPKQALVTGSSRDATLWIEGGQVVARLPQFRFTLRLTDLLLSVVALGNRRERGDTVFMESVVAPAALVEGFPVDVVPNAPTG